MENTKIMSINEISPNDLMRQTDEVRLKAWPKLLSLDRHGLEDFRQHLESPHPMTEQIQRDIDRSLTHFKHIRR